jgi:flagellar motor switch protein FliM
MSIDTLDAGSLEQLLDDPASVPASLGTDSNARLRALDADARLYDFRRPYRISKERLRSIEAMYDRMIKNLESYLLSRLRGQVELRLQGVEQFSFGEFTLSLQTPCTSYVIEINGAGGLQGVIDFGLDFSFFLVDRLFGGGSTPTLLSRPLTELEQDAVKLIAERTAQIVAEEWREVIPIRFEIVGFESSPEILQVCAREDPVLVANVEIVAGDISSLLMICLPFAALDEYFTSADTRRVSTTVRSEEELRAQQLNAEASLRNAKLPVAARLPAFLLSMRELSQLEPGLVLDTGITVDSLLSITVAGQPRFVASAGRSRGKLAARIAEGRLPDLRFHGSLTTAEARPA